MMTRIRSWALGIGLLALLGGGLALATTVPPNVEPGFRLINGTLINQILDFLRGTSGGQYTGTFNGTLGATTPNTVAGTTGTFSSTFNATGAATFGSTVGITGAETITSPSASALTVGLAGATNPALKVDASTASQAAGLSIKGAATGGTVAIAAIDSGSNTSVTINGKGSGTIGIGTVSTGAVTITPATTFGSTVGVTGAETVTSPSANALAVGLAGATNPAFNVDASTASQAAGLQVKGAATGGNVAISAIDSGSNTNLLVDAKGTGTIGIGTVSSGNVTVAAPLRVNAALNQFGSASGVPAHLSTAQTTAPALGSCGTGSPAITGTDTAGIVTMGTNATGCVITFNVAYTGTPYCVVSWIATPLASQSYVTANTAITLTQTSASGNKAQYICIGTAGG